LPSLEISNNTNNKRCYFKVDGTDTEIWYDNDGKKCAYGKFIDGEYVFFIPNIGYYTFNQNSKIVKFYNRLTKNNSRVNDAFFRTVIPMYLNVNGIQTLHASGVVCDKGVIAIAGKSGVGKSTIAYSFHKRNYKVWGDDTVAINIDNKKIDSFLLPFSLRIKDNNSNLLKLESEKFNNYSEFQDIKKEATFLPLLCIIELIRVDKPNKSIPALTRLNIPEALKTLLKHAYCFTLRDINIKKKMLGIYLEVSKNVPVYRLEFEENIKLLPKVLNEIENCFNSF